MEVGVRISYGVKGLAEEPNGSCITEPQSAVNHVYCNNLNSTSFIGLVQ